MKSLKKFLTTLTCICLGILLAYGLSALWFNDVATGKPPVSIPPSPTPTSRRSPPSVGANIGTRTAGDCSQDSNPPFQLMALLPLNNASDLRGGYTLSPSPTFWLYQPYTLAQLQTPSAPATLSFSLTEPTAEAAIYQSWPKPTITTDGPGLIQFSLPPGAVTLQADKDYYWHLQIFCQGKPAAATLSGWIRFEQNPQLLEQLAKVKDPLHKIQIYREKGKEYWYDAINELASLLKANPGDQKLIKLWQEVLTSPDFSLQALTNKPFVSFTTTSPSLK